MMTQKSDLTRPCEGGEEVDISAANHTCQGGVSRSLFIGIGGDVKVKTRDGSILTFHVQDGTELHVQVDMVYKIGTDAQSMVLMW